MAELKGLYCLQGPLPSLAPRGQNPVPLLLLLSQSSLGEEFVMFHMLYLRKSRDSQCSPWNYCPPAPVLLEGAEFCETAT